MRRRVLLALSVAGLLGTSVLAADEGEKSCCKNKKASASKVAAASSKLRCSLTGKVVDSCCCVQRDGKLHCTLAGKDVEACCCHPVSEKATEHKPGSTAQAPKSIR